ncbi:MAG TPA: hypothetical protein VMT49_02325 [Steroidobacteraceae bacterium]|nr:hypothetical protein [Steroidobacteraceae bacterium]
MRRIAVYLVLIALLAVSLALAWLATGAPAWCHMLGWCSRPVLS